MIFLINFNIKKALCLVVFSCLASSKVNALQKDAITTTSTKVKALKYIACVSIGATTGLILGFVSSSSASIILIFKKPYTRAPIFEIISVSTIASCLAGLMLGIKIAYDSEIQSNKIIALQDRIKSLELLSGLDTNSKNINVLIGSNIKLELLQDFNPLPKGSNATSTTKIRKIFNYVGAGLSGATTDSVTAALIAIGLSLCKKDCDDHDNIFMIQSLLAGSIVGLLFGIKSQHDYEEEKTKNVNLQNSVEAIKLFLKLNTPVENNQPS